MIGKPPTGPAAIPGSRGCWRALRGPKNPVPGCALGPGGVGVTRQEARRLCGGDRRGAHLLVPPGGKLQGVSEGRGARAAAFLCLTHRVLFLNPSGNVSSIQRGVLACSRLRPADTS